MTDAIILGQKVKLKIEGTKLETAYTQKDILQNSLNLIGSQPFIETSGLNTTNAQILFLKKLPGNLLYRVTRNIDHRYEYAPEASILLNTSGANYISSGLATAAPWKTSQNHFLYEEVDDISFLVGYDSTLALVAFNKLPESGEITIKATKTFSDSVLHQEKISEKEILVFATSGSQLWVYLITLNEDNSDFSLESRAYSGSSIFSLPSLSTSNQSFNGAATPSFKTITKLGESYLVQGRISGYNTSLQQTAYVGWTVLDFDKLAGNILFQGSLQSSYYGGDFTLPKSFAAFEVLDGCIGIVGTSSSECYPFYLSRDKKKYQFGPLFNLSVSSNSAFFRNLHISTSAVSILNVSYVGVPIIDIENIRQYDHNTDVWWEISNSTSYTYSLKETVLKWNCLGEKNNLGYMIFSRQMWSSREDSTYNPQGQSTVYFVAPSDKIILANKDSIVPFGEKSAAFCQISSAKDNIIDVHVMV